MMQLRNTLQWLKWSWHAPHVIYVAVAVVWGVVQLAIMPPYTVPDENSHYHRAWGIAQGDIVCQPGSIVLLPENVGAFFNTHEVHIGFPGSYTYADTAAFAGEPISSERTGVYTPACAYNPVSYVPAALAIGVVRLLGLSPFHAFYAARIAMLAVAIALTVWAIRRVPFGKWLFVLVALLPMVVQQYASVSADALTLSGLLLFVAVVLQSVGRERMQWKQLAVLLAVALVFVPLKPIYLPMLALVLLLRPRQFGGWKRYLGFMALFSVTTVAITLALYQLFAGAVPLQPSALIDPAAQLATLRQNPAEVIRYVHNDFIVQAVPYVWGLIGLPGWLHFTFVSGFYFLVLGIFAFVLTSVREEVRLAGWQRLIMLAVVYVNVVGFGIFMYVLWTPPGAQLLDGVQGRYFLPLLPLALLATTHVSLTRTKRALVIGLAVALVGMLTVGSLRNFYYLEPYQSTVPAHSTVVTNDLARVEPHNARPLGQGRYQATTEDPFLLVEAADAVGFSIQIGSSGTWDVRVRYEGEALFDDAHLTRVTLHSNVAEHTYEPRTVDLDLTRLEALTGRNVVEVRVDPTDKQEDFRLTRFDTYLP